MYSLPRLPPMFAASQAGHALNTAMRSFASAHSARLSLHLSRALSAQLTAALTCIQVHSASPIAIICSLALSWSSEAHMSQPGAGSVIP